jgi:hypothetical protein
MKILLVTFVSLFAIGCAHVGKESADVESRLVGVYEGRDVIDTEEIITLRKDQSFIYDFIPFAREGGASYHGHWKIDGKDLVLVAPQVSGGEEEFRLQVSIQAGDPQLTYTLAAHQNQRATMLIPNVFIRSKTPPAYRAIAPGEKPPNQSPEPTPTAVTPPAGQEARQP